MLRLIIFFLIFWQTTYSQTDNKTSQLSTEVWYRVDTLGLFKRLNYDSVDATVLGFDRLPSYNQTDSFRKYYSKNLKRLRFLGYDKKIPFCTSSYNEVIYFLLNRYGYVHGLEIVKQGKARKTDILPIRLKLKNFITDCYRIKIDDKYSEVLNKLTHLPISVF